MRDAAPFPALMRYAVVALTACTSRNWSVVSPGTRPVCHVAPPSRVRAHVAEWPLTQTTRSFTGLTACRSALVPLTCSVRAGTPAGDGDAAGPEHAASVASADRASAIAGS